MTRQTNVEVVDTLPSRSADARVHRKMMEVCGDAENRLASELMQHELQIEKDVLDPLSQLAEVRNLTATQTQVKYFKHFLSSLLVFERSHTPTICFLWSNNGGIDYLIGFLYFYRLAWHCIAANGAELSTEVEWTRKSMFHIDLFW